MRRIGEIVKRMDSLMQRFDSLLKRADFVKGGGRDEGPSDEWYEKAEDKIYQEQERWIERKFSHEDANSANYGWFVDNDEGYIEVQTKVYTKGILESSCEYPGFRVRHSFTPFR